MTENERKEAIAWCKIFADINGCNPNHKIMLRCIEALEEIQQYRAIGTVEGYKRAIEISKENFRVSMEYKAKVQEYEKIGTVDEFKALKEKNTPKKPILNNPKIDEFYVKEAKLCPVCHSYINDFSGDYCRDCGQKLDWSE